MILSEKYLAQFERSSGLKKGTVGTVNHLYETYMSDARQEGSIYKFFIVMDLNGQSKIIGGNDYKQDAIDGANEYLESGIRLKVYSGQFLRGKGINPEDDSNWGNQDDINSAMQAAGGGGQQMQQEALAGVPSQADVDAFQASEYEGNDEPENDKDAESQDALHLGEGSTPLGLAHGHLNTAGEERRKAMTGQMNSLKRDRHVNSALNQLGHARQEKAFNDNPQKADSDRAKTYAAQGKTGRMIPENESGFDDDGDAAYDAHRDSMLEIDNMMAGNDGPSTPDMGSSSMGGGDEWMDEPNDGQMNSLGGVDELDLDEGMTAPDLNGSRAGAALSQDNAAFYRSKIADPNAGNRQGYMYQHKISVDSSTQSRAGKGSQSPRHLPEQELGEEENLYGTRAGVAKSMDNNADFRKNVLPLAKPHQKSMAHDVGRNVQKGTTIQRKSGQNFGQFKSLPEQALSLNEDSKALYAKAKVSEAEYERFLRNAGIKK